MAQIILNDSEYTFDASAKTVTLGAPYTGLSTGQIISIVDLKTNDVLYDSVAQRTDPISISGAVITHTHGKTGQADADKLQITVDAVPSGKGKALILTNASAVALTEDSDMNGLYTIVLSGGGAQDAEFYIPVDDVNVNEQIVLKLRVNSAVQINTADFQTYAQGAYITDPAYAAGPVAADGSSEEWTSMFPLRDFMNKGNKHRVRVNVAGDCTVSLIAMVVTL